MEKHYLYMLHLLLCLLCKLELVEGSLMFLEGEFGWIKIVE